MLRAGQRMKAMRELFGLTREQMSKTCGINENRYRNVERQNAKMNEDEFLKVGSLFPEFLPWLAIEGPINIHDLKNSKNGFCASAAERIENGLIPTGYYLERAIKGFDIN